MRVFCLCVYSFVICWSPLGVFGAHFVLLGTTLGLLLGLFGAPWAPKRLSLASLWTFFGSLGMPWDHLGHLGLPSGAWDDFGSKMEANGPQLARLRIKSDLARGIQPPQPSLSPLSGVSTQSGARAAAPNPTSLAPGARMT